MNTDKENIIKALSEALGIDFIELSNINADQDLRDWGMDSLKSIDVIVSLESEFGIEIEDEDLMVENFNTVEKMVKLINKYVNSK
ncbi:MAG: acyl carrier protein [Ruminiclostridium sp.]